MGDALVIIFNSVVIPFFALITFFCIESVRYRKEYHIELKDIVPIIIVILISIIILGWINISIMPLYQR